MTHRLRLGAALLTTAALAIGAVAARPARHAGTAVPHPRAAAPSWPPLRTAGTFLLLEIRQKADARWDEAWRRLYPAHRLVAARALYVRCEQATPFPAPLQSLRVLRVRRAAVRVPGLPGPVPGVAVTVRVGLEWYGPRDPIEFTFTFHLVPERGRWTWLLSPSRYRLYRDEGCGFRPAA